MREIKFRAWTKDPDSDEDNPTYFMCYDLAFEEYGSINDLLKGVKHLMQYIGFKDKNGKGSCIYEGDFVDLQGNIKGNLYENPEMVEDSTYLLIQGFGTKDWLTTYTKAVERGCNDSE